MPTKTTKKASKKQTPTPSALVASSMPLAPPCAGQAPYSGTWSIFPRDGNYPPLPPPCPGFWSAVRHYPLSGGIVAQLGAQPGTGYANCLQYVGYRFDFTPNVSYELVFNLTLNLGPVTVRPRYGWVDTLAWLQIWGPNGYAEDPRWVLSSYTSVSLCVRLQMQAGAQHTLQYWVTPVVYNVGYQSYGEIIVNSSSLAVSFPYGVKAAEVPSFDVDVAAKREHPLALVDRDKKHKGQKISMEEAIRKGTAEIPAK